MTQSISDFAMLVSLNIRQWSGRKLDRAVTKEVDKSHGATDGGRYNKLLVDKAHLDPIAEVAGAARAYLYKMTLPWGDNGDRMLIAKLFMDFTQTIQQFGNTFHERSQVLFDIYPQLKQDARKRLGTMYDPDDYPSDIRDRFHFGTSYSALPTANDFRVDLSKEHVEFIKRDIAAKLEERQTEAIKDVYQRVRAIVGKIHEQTSVDKRRIFDSSMENAEEFVNLLPALNFTNDPTLVDIERDIRDLLVPPDRLRQDKDLRQTTAQKADAILARLPWA